MEDDAEFKTGTQELQTVHYNDFLDPFLPSGPQKKYILPGTRARAKKL